MHIKSVNQLVCLRCESIMVDPRLDIRAVAQYSAALNCACPDIVLLYPCYHEFGTIYEGST